jgi:hypothetical protein
LAGAARTLWRGVLLVALLAPLAAGADDAPPGLLGKWGEKGAPDGCKTNSFTIAADAGITVVEPDAGPRRIMTYKIEGTTLVVNNAGHLERAPFKLDGDTLILSPGTPQEKSYARCAG